MSADPWLTALAERVDHNGGLVGLQPTRSPTSSGSSSSPSFTSSVASWRRSAPNFNRAGIRSQGRAINSLYLIFRPLISVMKWASDLLLKLSGRASTPGTSSTFTMSVEEIR